MSWSWLWWIVLIYFVGFVLTFVGNVAIGPVTLGLSLVRALLWPLYVLTGMPAGMPMTMD